MYSHPPGNKYNDRCSLVMVNYSIRQRATSVCCTVEKLLHKRNHDVRILREEECTNDNAGELVNVLKKRSPQSQLPKAMF